MSCFWHILLNSTNITGILTLALIAVAITFMVLLCFAEANLSTALFLQNYNFAKPSWRILSTIFLHLLTLIMLLPALHAVLQGNRVNYNLLKTAY